MGNLIQSLDVFHEAHVPEKLFFRHSQLARLMFAIGIAQKSERPMSVVLYFLHHGKRNVHLPVRTHADRKALETMPSKSAVAALQQFFALAKFPLIELLGYAIVLAKGGEK